MNEKDIRAAIRKVRDTLEPNHRTGGVFWPLALGAGLGLPMLPCTPNCDFGSQAEYEAPAPFPATTTTITTSTSSSSTTTTEPYCQADLTQATGATEECTACVGQWCCGQALAFVAEPSGQNYADLFACAVPSSAPCSYACTEELCSLGFRNRYAFYQACAACINANCCAEFIACDGDPTCFGSCLGSWDAACCEPGSSYQPYDQCIATSCAWVCPPIFLCSAGAGGAGGAGGGGSGGAAGTGGAGGSGGASGGAGG
jgi:hypothetical protein